ncbi:MAG: hypothetical protein A3A97_01365 [Candidatus Terrybacteria bacterium RIFCSPLOWO2_01_FULL_40_23]|uniref:Uncharacterized protein n=1 Tax=Candidatus Terrybacteria bacterium RIFCSPLOWO2_01_FULL_40_23 TaxID=1802366 RepID=A0A1G2PQA0_9BACT|nr:MAG: hypothetical protein A3A97_01365 [Candidatus Terrybacteria bacterium RIFCSPLOWO2_01_FULL_40_23]
MNTITIPKKEYLRLKGLDQKFADLLRYFEYLTDIQKSRKEIRTKKYIAQEELFSLFKYKKYYAKY